MENASLELMTKLIEKPLLYKGDKCVTPKLVDALHDRTPGSAQNIFDKHKARFQEGKHYHYKPYGEWSQEDNGSGYWPEPNQGRGGHRGDLILFTEKGYCFLVKVFDDDRAWAVQEELVDGYFRQEAGSTAVVPFQEAIAQIATRLQAQEEMVCRLLEVVPRQLETLVQTQQDMLDRLLQAKTDGEESKNEITKAVGLLGENLAKSVGTIKRSVEAVAQGSAVKAGPDSIKNAILDAYNDGEYKVRDILEKPNLFKKYGGELESGGILLALAGKLMPKGSYQAGPDVMLFFHPDRLRRIFLNDKGWKTEEIQRRLEEIQGHQNKTIMVGAKPLFCVGFLAKEWVTLEA